MRILHYYPDEPQSMITAYVTTLCNAMGVECQNEKATRKDDALQMLRKSHFDVLHVHGCWRNSQLRVVRQALSEGTRLVVSPHGQLEPWVMDENYWKEKLPKKLLYQRRIVSSAYAVVIQGKMEEECLRLLGWNKRTVIIRNSLITHSITDREMASQMSKLYRKVMDTNPLELMTDDTRYTLRQLLIAGITGDERWLKERCITIADSDQWRMLYCYAHQEKLTDTIGKGIRILRLDAPDIDVKTAPWFRPEGYEPADSIEHAIGSHFATENERLIATFRQLRKLALRRQLTIAHLVELDKELRFHDSVEDDLCEELEEHRLLKFAARLMSVANALTGLEEGFMPMAPLNDRTARLLKKQIDNHLNL